jgi:hypothetical protein
LAHPVEGVEPVSLLSSWDEDFPAFPSPLPPQGVVDEMARDSWERSVDQAIGYLAWAITDPLSEDLGRDFWRRVLMGLALRAYS